MRFSAVVSTFLSFAACVWAANITVQVGENGGLTFSPDTVNATAGDIINFQFLTKNHSATQSSFDDPCTRLATGVDSDYQPVSTNATTIPQWSFTVENATTPLWFFCKQGSHCRAGMVFAVNPTANKTFAEFKDKATSGNSSSSSQPSSGGSSTGSVPSPSASNKPSSGAALGLGPSKLAGIITLMAIFVGSIF